MLGMTSLSTEHLSHILLFDPFTKHCSVPTKYRELLSVSEFFEKCYYAPDYEILESELASMREEEVTGLDSPIGTENLRQKYHKQKNESLHFLNWLSTNGDGIYLITGNAGTGKTTYLRYLEHTYIDYNWVILDLADSNPRIEFSSSSFSIKPKPFDRLTGKVFSALMREITNFFFDTYPRFDNSSLQPTNRCPDFRKNIHNFLEKYNLLVAPYMPPKEIEKIINSLGAVQNSLNDIEYCQQCGEILCSNFKKLCYNNINNAIDLALEFIQIILFIISPNKKNIIVFDNIERYIGTTEIYDSHIQEFTEQLRNFSNQYRNKFRNKYLSHFQFVVAMRDTTVRKYTPEQIADYRSNSLDISTWFSANKILKKKTDWLNEKEDLPFYDDNFKLLNQRLNRILFDIGRTGGTLRGLSVMLDLLFNHNKRLIVSYLVEILADPTNSSVIKSIDSMKENHNDERQIADLKKHAFRSTVWRLVCDKMRTDNTFGGLVPDYDKVVTSNTKTPVFSNLVLARRILTILNNHSIRNVQNRDMSFFDLIISLYPQHRNEISTWFFCNQCRSTVWPKLSNILFLLNSSSRHDGYWFRYIDVQCNHQTLNQTLIPDAESFCKYLFDENAVRSIKIHITDTGRAYLIYIVHTFEQISSFYFKNPPLFTLIPTKEELLSVESLDELPCLQKIKMVISKKNEIEEFLLQPEENRVEVSYISSSQDLGTPFVVRMKNATKGYLGNLSNYIKLIYRNDPEVSEIACDLAQQIFDI